MPRVRYYSLRRGANSYQDNADRIIAWAKVNGLDAEQMPESQVIRADEGKLTVTVLVESVDAIRLGDEVDRIEVRRTVPLVEPPPDDLFESYSAEG